MPWLLSNINTLTVDTIDKKKMINIKNIIIDSKSGYSGAGRGVHKKYKNKNLYRSLSVYGIPFHRHNSEINQELNKYSKKKLPLLLHPIYHRCLEVILSTIYIDLNKKFTINTAYSELKKFYKNDKFIKVLKNNSLISTNNVINTNNCLISLCKTEKKNKLVILSSIDNLIKGGQGKQYKI